MKFTADENLGYWLFYAQRTVAHAFAEVLKTCCIEHEKPYIVTPPQWGVLHLLYEHDGLTVSAISRRRGIDAPTVTGIVTRLEQSGLLERRHDLADHRNVKVYLTAEGKSCVTFLLDAVDDSYEAMVRGFSEEEQHDLRVKLQRLIANATSIEVGADDRFGLLGPNGSGKTTTINMISGLSVPTSGEVRVMGYDVRPNGRQVRQILGSVPQETALYEELSAWTNMDFHADLFGVPRREKKQRIIRLLELVQLLDRKDSRVGTFSGGRHTLNAPQHLQLTSGARISAGRAKSAVPDHND